MSAFSINRAWKRKSKESFDTYQEYLAACSEIESLERRGQKGSQAYRAAVAESVRIKGIHDSVHMEAERLRIAGGPASARVEKVQRFVIPIAVAMIFLLLFPAIGAVHFSAGIWAALLTSIVFAVAVDKIFSFALVVEILIADNYHPKLAFYGFVAALIIAPTALVLLAGALFLITVSSIALTVVAVVLTIATTWFTPFLISVIV